MCRIFCGNNVQPGGVSSLMGISNLNIGSPITPNEKVNIRSILYNCNVYYIRTRLIGIESRPVEINTFGGRGSKKVAHHWFYGNGGHKTALRYYDKMVVRYYTIT